MVASLLVSYFSSLPKARLLTGLAMSAANPTHPSPGTTKPFPRPQILAKERGKISRLQKGFKNGLHWEVVVHAGMVKKGRLAQLVIRCEWHYLTSGPEHGWVSRIVDYLDIRLKFQDLVRGD